MTTKQIQGIVATVTAGLILAFALWLTKVNSTLDVMLVQISGIREDLGDIKVESRREIDGVTRRVERLEAKR